MKTAEKCASGCPYLELGILVGILTNDEVSAKPLRDAYDTASVAVHSGEVPGKRTLNLEKVQDLCRQGILKLLDKGAPEDWGDLILGVSPS